jgi:hypothetical protein
MTTSHDIDVTLETRRDKRHQAEVRRARGIVELLDDRTDLRGVYARADLVDDAVRWTA